MDFPHDWSVESRSGNKNESVIKQVTVGDFRVLIEVFPLAGTRETCSRRKYGSKIAFSAICLEIYVTPD